MADAKTPNMNPAELFREEIFSDQKTGSIRRLVPVTPEGEIDTSRPVQYIGSAQVMSPMGAIPISFTLDAATVGEAAEKFGAAAEKAIEETARELEQMRRDAQSQIMVPGQKPGGMGMPPGGMGGGGGGIIT